MKRKQTWKEDERRRNPFRQFVFRPGASPHSTFVEAQQICLSGSPAARPANVKTEHVSDPAPAGLCVIGSTCLCTHLDQTLTEHGFRVAPRRTAKLRTRIVSPIAMHQDDTCIHMAHHV